jgi:hypothetical protein
LELLGKNPPAVSFFASVAGRGVSAFLATSPAGGALADAAEALAPVPMPRIVPFLTNVEDEPPGLGAVDVFAASSPGLDGLPPPPAAPPTAAIGVGVADGLAGAELPVAMVGALDVGDSSCASPAAYALPASDLAPINLSMTTRD